MFFLDISLKEFSLCGWQRMVFLKESHNTFRPVRHVLTNHECQVASFDVLVVDKHLRIERISDPMCISLVSNSVVSARKDGNRNCGNVLDWDEIGLLCWVDECIIVVRPHLESLFSQVLRVE